MVGQRVAREYCYMKNNGWDIKPCHDKDTYYEEIEKSKFIKILKPEDLQYFDIENGKIKIPSTYIVTFQTSIDSPFKGAFYSIKVKYRLDYPFVVPIMTFQQRIYHFRINNGGSIRTELLGRRWSPNFTIEKILIELKEWLNDPYTDAKNNMLSGLFPDFHMHTVEDYDSYKETALDWAKRFALQPPVE